MIQPAGEQSKVLIVDDDHLFVEDLRSVVARSYRWITCHRFEDAAEVVRRERPDLILLDIGSPDDPEAGFSTLLALTGGSDAPPVIMLTAEESRDTVVRAICGGAVDFLSKGDLRRDSHSLLFKMEHQLDRHRRQVPSAADEDPMVVVDAASHRLMEEITRVAPTSYSVLIHGETGTGKELVAGRIHRFSKRRLGPMRAVNCAAMPDDLLESILFGSVPGAFTGATVRRGEFELAEGGTLFLDEISAASLKLQDKLLRVLETGDYQRMGCSEIRMANIRLIAATNRDPQQAMADGELKPDFYYRVADYELRVPSLKERPADIIPLAYRFLGEAATETDRPGRLLTPDLEEALLNYDWPGNVRQLRNEIRRAMIQGNRRELGIGSFFSKVSAADHAQLGFAEAKQKLVDDFERRFVTHHLSLTKGNIQEAAGNMGLARQHRHRLLNKHKIDPNEWRTETCAES